MIYRTLLVGNDDAHAKICIDKHHLKQSHKYKNILHVLITYKSYSDYNTFKICKHEKFTLFMPLAE